jgi:hypothetical protein
VNGFSGIFHDTHSEKDERGQLIDSMKNILFLQCLSTKIRFLNNNNEQILHTKWNAGHRAEI